MDWAKLVKTIKTIKDSISNVSVEPNGQGGLEVSLDISLCNSNFTLSGTLGGSKGKVVYVDHKGPIKATKTKKNRKNQKSQKGSSGTTDTGYKYYA